MKIKTETKIGIVGVLTIAILVWGINFLKGKNLFSKYNTYYAKYTDINGLLPTSYVFINGMKVGKVTNITYMDSQMKNFLVSFDIPANIKIPSNSIAEVYNSDILGSKAMRIIIGNSPTELSGNDTLLSQSESSMFSEIGKMLTPYTDKVENIISNLDSVVISVNEILDKNSQQEIKSMIVNVNQLSANLASLSSNLDNITSQEKEKIHLIVENVEKLSKTFKENDDKLASIIDNIANISDTLAHSNISSTMNDINNSLASLSSTLNKINVGKGNLGLLVNDDNLYKNLERSTQNLDSLINDIKTNPKRYLNISIF
ncbi:MAG: MCE family protein [Bacteroidales bacterium]|nr:MCE family protein [Bacteroidales bacterium]MBR5778975.1 MCE family protein [Bacteroidales bacterium]